MKQNVRTRFAPSPTGVLHAGTIRTALFAWLIAKQSNGEFILRIEDTDQAREVEGAVDNIIKSLKYLGLDWQEGPDIGGPHQPYLQSKRLDSYKEWAYKLIDAGRAYADPYTQSELEKLREEAKLQKKPFLFRDYRPDNPPKWDGAKPLRFKSNPTNYHWKDEVLGELKSGPEVIDDFIIIKSDGFPTYNFAHIIDDELMGITHIVRSQEFTSSMPKFLNIYDALELNRPIFVTLPPVLGEDGKKKLSKREGAKQILDFEKEGYLPETIINYLATLGWNDGTTQEIFSTQEIIDKFSIKRIQKGGAKLDQKRLDWISGSHIRNKTVNELYKLIDEKWWTESSHNYDDEYKKKVLGLIQERLKHFDEIENLTWFFFEEPKIDIQQIRSDWKIEINFEQFLKILTEKLIESDFSVDDLQQKLNSLLHELNLKPKELFPTIRLLITGSTATPSLSETFNLLGKHAVINRLQDVKSL